MLARCGVKRAVSRTYPIEFDFERYMYIAWMYIISMYVTVYICIWRKRERGRKKKKKTSICRKMLTNKETCCSRKRRRIIIRCSESYPTSIPLAFAFLCDHRFKKRRGRGRRGRKGGRGKGRSGRRGRKKKWIKNEREKEEKTIFTPLVHPSVLRFKKSHPLNRAKSKRPNENRIE